MSVTNTFAWERLAAEELDEESKPKLRMSGTGHCVRRMAYAHRGTLDSDPPDSAAKNKMALGKMAEILIVRDLWERGWETAHTVLDDGGQLELEIEIPGSNIRPTGHPDGICRHERYTRNHWIPLEAKSMSPNRAEDTAYQGVAEVYPHYMSQIAMYGRALYGMNLVSHPERGVFAIMDREGNCLPPERVAWSPTVYEEAMDRCRQAVAEEMPERPYLPNSSECRFCPYRSLCWGKDVQHPAGDGEQTPPGEPRAVNAEDERTLEAARAWIKLKPMLDQAAGALQQTCDFNGGDDIRAEDVTAGYFVPRDPPDYDPKKLQELVPGDILRNCLTHRQPI